MGYTCYGRKAREDADEVRYAFGESESDPHAGELVIPVDRPSDWFVLGRDDKPKAAIRVVGKASRLHGESGQWPESASVFS